VLTGNIAIQAVHDEGIETAGIFGTNAINIYLPQPVL
jgi:hypothetical protein